MNLKFAWEKARSSKANYRSTKLTVDQVREILKSCGTVRDIAKKFNVSPETISSIKRRKTWIHVEL